MFLLYVKAKVYQNILKLGYWTPAFTLCKDFLITKKSSVISIPNSFAAWFLKKKKKLFSHYILLTDQTSLPDVFISCDLEVLVNMCIVIICCPVCDLIGFEINHSFLIKPIFYITKKWEKNVNISKTKRAFNMI